MKEYIYAENINKTGETGIVNTKTIKVLCLCPKENADIILNALELNKYSEAEVKELLQELRIKLGLFGLYDETYPDKWIDEWKKK